MNKEIVTQDIKVPQNTEMLKKYFSHCFDKNGNFDFEKFKNELSENEIDFYKESYGMDWLGKSYARLLATDNATTLLKENTEFNKKKENKNSENILLKGDNLEVLKHLANAYYEKIKMIYIDPPYNTGSDGFVYEDDRKFSNSELRQLAGISEEKAKQILDFTQSKSNSHSAWLTFIYPRLYIAKQLLKDDGVIFISIDDNEVAQLRLLMDEIFGEENFVGNIIWQTATDNNPSQISTEHEYVICYSKNGIYQEAWEIPSTKGHLIQKKYTELKEEFNTNDKIQTELRKWIRKQKNGDDLSGIAHYSYVDNEGVFYPGNSANTKPGGYTFDVLHPITKKVCAKPAYGYRFTKETFEKKDKNNNVLWGSDELIIPKIKKRLNSVMEKLKSYYYEDNRATSKKLKDLFDDKKVFNNPKSVNFIKKTLEFTTDKQSIILDFFAGSGTTGDAVMQLNAQDGGNRKYILVQIPEKIDEKKNKIAYEFVKEELKVEEPTIFEITKERLIRASQKINSETINTKIAEKEKEIKNLEGQLDFENKEVKTKQLKTEIKALKNQDLGFKIFETMPIWEDYDFEADELNEQLKLFDESKLTKEDINALLITWKTYDGIPLSQDLQKTDLVNYTGYYTNSKLYLMEKGFKTENLKNLLQKIDTDKNFNPTTIISFGYHFESKNLREIAENIKSYANKKNIDIDFIIRY
ncbi:MAG: site-specific DNA-methyltransferase [Bacteroidota bacterium]|nr:site-specific DNA-methyltransferase [Bacteroidota bacterium]